MREAQRRNLLSAGACPNSCGDGRLARPRSEATPPDNAATLTSPAAVPTLANVQFFTVPYSNAAPDPAVNPTQASLPFRLSSVLRFTVLLRMN